MSGILARLLRDGQQYACIPVIMPIEKGDDAGSIAALNGDSVDCMIKPSQAARAQPLKNADRPAQRRHCPA